MPLRAMVLEEDRATKLLVTERLAEEGYETVLCPDISAVLDAVERNNVQICVVGARYRGVDGYDIVRQLRHKSGAGLILLGNSEDEIDAVLALEMGADDYMVKPVRPRELCARVRAVVRRIAAAAPDADGARPMPSPSLRRVGNVEICGVRRSVRIGGQPIELTTFEFDVLMVLVAHTNAILSRDQIIKSVRGNQWSISDRSVDGIISRLRRKLFAGEEGNRRIKTVHGRGYMLLEAQMLDEV